MALKVKGGQARKQSRRPRVARFHDALRVHEAVTARGETYDYIELTRDGVKVFGQRKAVLIALGKED